MKRNILIAVLVIAVAGGFIGYRMYNEKTPTASGKKADVSVEAGALFQAFSQDEAVAGKLYNDKVIQVRGTVREVSAPGNSPVNVLLETGDAMGAVVCEFDSTFSPDWSVGQQVTVKGICAGFSGLPGMGDVILQRCAAVE